MPTATVKKENIEVQDIFDVYAAGRFAGGHIFCFDAEISRIAVTTDREITIDLKDHKGPLNNTPITIKIKKSEVGEALFMKARTLRSKDLINVTGEMQHMASSKDTRNVHVSNFKIITKAAGNPLPR